MRFHSTIGFVQPRDQVLAALERALGLKMQARESERLGSYEVYPPRPRESAQSEAPDFELSLRDNVDPRDGTPARPEAPECAALLDLTTDTRARQDELWRVAVEAMKGKVLAELVDYE